MCTCDFLVFAEIIKFSVIVCLKVFFFLGIKKGCNFSYKATLCLIKFIIFFFYCFWLVDFFSAFIYLYICKFLQMDGGLSIWAMLATLILSRGGVGERMERNGGARGMLLQIRSIVKDTLIGAAIVQESPWKARPAMQPLGPLI